ncbi:MAG TPA: PDR/VanB family oxidoreductase [Trebonia sp.]|jgi:ferredoxin-NADP reductase|nr:PDR/VanB family oxidoreductase [Trebonia sp.]
MSELRVTRVEWEAESVVSLRLSSPDRGELPRWEPGAHIDVLLPSGIIRQYSLCGDPRDPSSYTIAVLRESHGTGSKEIHDTSLVGRLLEIRGPRNHFRLEAAPAYRFLAGGIGITPILAMVREAEERGVPWELYYGGRSRAHMAFADELAAQYGDRVHLVPQDTAGMLDLAGILAESPIGSHVYCCGPEGMLRAAEEACAAADPPRRLHLERFGPGPVTEEPSVGSAEAFKVELRRSGIVLDVPPDRPLLDVIRDALPGTPYSCEEGYCGTCETRVLEGVPEHHDQVLTPEEREKGDTMMLCVGRSRTPVLVLDI